MLFFAAAYHPVYAPAREKGAIPNPLDPISPGRFTNLQQINTRFGRQALAWITDSQKFEDLLQEDKRYDIDWRRKTKPEYEQHFRVLRDAAIVVDVGDTLKEIQHISSYFSVPKSATEDRAIFNGYKLSRRFLRPPPVGLPQIPYLLRQICEIQAQEEKPLSMLCFDVRHAFHRIKIADAISRRWFVLPDHHGTFVRWTTVPMGFSYSPRICQSLIFSFILHELKDTDGHGITNLQELKDSEHPPSFIVLKRGTESTGLLFLWYDNIVCLTTCNIQYRAWFAQLAHIRRTFNVEWKEEKLHPGKKNFIASAPPGTLPCFLGLEVGVHEDHGQRRSTKYRCSFMWRHKTDNITEWSQLKLSGHPTCRQVAQLIGVCIWDCYISSAPLANVSSVLAIARLIHKQSRQGWDSPFSITSDQRTELLTRLSGVVENPWRTIPCRYGRVFAASDSSDECGAWVTFNGFGEVASHRCIVWDEQLRNAHIFVKELLAVVIFIEECDANNSLIFLGIDNTAAAFVLKRLYSRTKAGSELVSRAVASLDKKNNSLRVVNLKGEWNLADCPTRFAKYKGSFDEQRREQTWSTLQAAASGSDLQGSAEASSFKGSRDEDDALTAMVEELDMDLEDS